MTTIADVSVRFKGDVGTLLSDARQQGLRAGTNAGESFAESFNEAGKRLIKGFIGAELILKSVELLRDATKAAREDQLLTDQLTQAIRANAAARATDTEEIEKQIVAAARLGFTDNEVKQSLVGLVSATHDLDEAIRVQNVAMDLARFKHISLQEASDALVKVEGGRFRLLAGLGIQLDAHATKEQALTAVERVAAGQRETFAATDEGAAKRRDAAYDKLLETIGYKLLPLETGLADFMTGTLFPAISTVVDNLDRLAPALDVVAALLGIKVLNAALGAVAGLVGFGAAEATTAAEAGAATGAETALAVSIDSVAVASGAAIPEIIGLAAAEDGLAASAGAASTAIGAGAGGGLLGMIGRLIPAGAGVVAISREQIDSGHQLVETWYNQREAAGLVTTGIDLETIALLSAKDAADGFVGSTDTAAAATSDFNGVLDQGTAFFRQFTTVQGETGAGLDNVGARARAAALGFDVLAGSAWSAAQAEAAATQQRLSAIRVQGPSADIGFAGRGLTGIDSTSRDQELFVANARQHIADVAAAEAAAAAARNRRSRRGGGGSTVSQAAKDEAATIRADMTTAYNAAKAAGDAFYDKMHQRILDHIAKVHQQASDEIATERTKVNDWLAEEQRKNAAPVTAAERDLAALQHQRQMRNLQEGLQAALESGNPTQIRAAQEQLEEARMQERIDALKAQQAKDDAIATQTAKNEQLALDARQKAADDKAKADANAENDEAPKRKKRFDDALADWYRHLTAVKGHHKSSIKELNDLWAKFGLDGKDHGKKFGTELAAGLKSEMKAVESAAESLAAAVAKYIKTGSPAEAGIFHDDPPEKMGARVSRQWLEGAVQVLAQSGPQIDNAVRAGPGSALGGQRSQAGQNGQGSPAGYDPARWAYYVANGGAASGLTYQEWLAAVGAGTQPNEFGMTPGMYSAQATTYRDPLTQVDRTSGQSYSGIGPQGGGAPTINVEVNNPTAEPASTSAKRELQLLAATGILG